MSIDESPTFDNIIDYLLKDIEGKHGIICLNSIIIESELEDITNFMKLHNMQIPKEKIITKFEYLKFICLHFFYAYNDNPQLENIFEDLMSFIGKEIYQEENFKKYIPRFDIKDKKDILDIFTDYCGDLGKDVYTTDLIPVYSVDLYVIKEKPRFITEAVFLRTAAQMNEKEYNKVLKLIEEAGKMADQTNLVTTPLGVYKIGLKKIIEDMERLNAQLYVVDPSRKKIFGITRGTRSKDYHDDFRHRYMQRLPSEPLRTSAGLEKITDYEFEVRGAYKSQSYIMYGIVSSEEHDRIEKI